MNHQTLFEAGEHFRLLVESVQDYAIYMLDPSGKIVTWNTGAERIKGYRTEEIIGKHFACFYPMDDIIQGKPSRELEMAASSGRCEDEGWRVRRDGSKFWANVIITAIRDGTGDLIGYSKVTRDLTERKRAEDALRSSHDELERRVRDRTVELMQVNQTLKANEERFRLLIESIKDYAIYTLDADGNITSWNSGAARIYGYSSDEIIGRHRSCFFTKHDVALGLPQSELVDAMDYGRFSEEAWRVRKDGSLFWANGAITPLWDVHGDIQGFVKVVRDLTERKNAETALHKTLTELQLRDRAMQAVSHGIFIFDPFQPGEPIIYASPGFERMTGFDLNEILGNRFDFLRGPKSDADTYAKTEEAIRAGRGISAEDLNYRKDGTSFWNARTLSPVLNERGELIQFVGVDADISQRRSLEDQLRQSQKMEAVGQLTSGIAHDFNNLLTVILGYGDSLVTELSTTDSRHPLAQAIVDAGNEAADLTRQLLAFSRQSISNPQIVDLNHLIADIERMLMRVIGEDVSLTIILDPTIGPMKVDPGQMSQVLMNLVVNARDAMPCGGKLTIETKRVELDEPYVNTHVEVAAGRHVLLSVTDTGTGMTPEVRSRIFDPFFTTKPVGKGTGLGLSVVHGIVKQSHGHIGAYTEFGVGTTFKIYLPVVEGGIVARNEPLPPSIVGGHGETVFVVEDDNEVRRFTVLALKSHGYTVLAASNGAAALQLLNSYEDRIDLLLTDVVMPEINGRQLVEAMQPNWATTKILYVSGYTSDTIVRHGVLNAHVAFLPKPYTRAALLQKVRQVLDGDDNSSVNS